MDLIRSIGSLSSLVVCALATSPLFLAEVPVPAQNPLIRTNIAKDRLLIFEANRGQLPPDGEYLSRTAHYTVLLRKNAVSFTIPGAMPNIHSAEHFPAGLDHPSPGPPASVTMTFAGSHSKLASVPDGELASQSNYFLGRTEKQWVVAYSIEVGH